MSCVQPNRHSQVGTKGRFVWLPQKYELLYQDCELQVPEISLPSRRFRQDLVHHFSTRPSTGIPYIVSASNATLCKGVSLHTVIVNKLTAAISRYLAGCSSSKYRSDSKYELYCQQVTCWHMHD